MYTYLAILRTDTGDIANMSARKPLKVDDGEVRELTAGDFAQAVPFFALPEELKSLLSSPEITVVPDTAAKIGKQSAA